MVNVVKIFLIFCFFLFSQSLYAKSREYFVGSLGITNFNQTTDDLQALNTSLVNLGFSSATSSTDNTGGSIKIGYGFEDDGIAIEGYFQHLGTLTVNTTLTGPSETLKTEIDAYGLGLDFIGKYSFEDKSALLGRIGFFSYDTDVTISTTQGSVSGPLSTGTSLTLGTGYQSGNWRYEWQIYTIDETVVDNFSVSYLF